MDTFVPMIVDTRIKLDIPRGMAARGKHNAGREQLIAMAKQEFVADMAPEKHRAICDGRQAMVEAMPPERLKELKAMGGDGCLAEADCQGFTRCVAPILEKMLSAAPARQIETPAPSTLDRQHAILGGGYGIVSDRALAGRTPTIGSRSGPAQGQPLPDGHQRGRCV
jgi:hypothetical protein